MQRYCRCR